MATAELYAPVRGLHIPVKTYPELDGISVDSTVLGSLGLQNRLNLVGVDNKTPYPQEQIDEDTLRRISRYHGRSYEVVLPPESYFFDQFGNPYSALSLKGGRLTEPYPFVQTTNPSGLAIFGMQDSDSLTKTLRNSDALRAGHISTEWIVGLAEPEALPFEGEIFARERFKDRLVKRTLEASESDLNFGDFPKDKYRPFSEFMDNTTFFLTVRAMPGNERLMDLTEPLDKEGFLRILGKAFAFVNWNERRLAMEDPNYKAEFFNIESQEDIDNYLLEYLPKKYGQNLGRMHNLGLAHRYLHAGNVLLTGGIVDLDSPRGEIHGPKDKPRSEYHFSRDCEYLLYGEDTISGANVLKMLSRRGFIRGEMDKVILRFSDNFFRAYYKERGFWEILQRNEHSNKAIADPIALSAHKTLTASVMMDKSEGIDFPNKINTNPKPVIKEVLKRIKDQISDPLSGQEQQSALKTLEEYALGYLTDQLNERAADHLKAYGEKHGSGALNTYIRLQAEEMTNQLIDKYGQALASRINKSKVKEGYYRRLVQRYLYRRVNRDLNLEEDILANLDKIISFFNGFTSDGDLKILTHLIDAVEKQLGQTFDTTGFDFDKFVNGYLTSKGKHEVKTFRDMRQTLTPQEQFDRWVGLTRPSELDRGHDRFIQDHFFLYWKVWAEREAKKALGPKLREVKKRYGASSYEAVMKMFRIKFEVGPWPDNIDYQQISERASRLTGRRVQKILQEAGVYPMTESQDKMAA